MISIGIDESGTGAWAGPFYVCGVASRKEEAEQFRKMGVKDSKLLSDGRRRRLFDGIADTALLVRHQEVPVQEINAGPGCWATAVWKVCFSMLSACSEMFPDEGLQIIVDGRANSKVIGLFKKAGRRPPRFVIRADNLFPEVSAASVIAKTLRNNRMVELANTFPGYHWEKNAGYGTPEHQAAIELLGITPQHRAIKRLRGYFYG